MPEFSLEPGTTRLGQVYDDDPDTPPLVGMLQRNDAGEISVTLSWEDDGGYLTRWFLGGHAKFTDDPDRSRYRYSVPEVLMFQDTDGAASLLYCRATEASLGAVGTGRANAAYAVLDVDEFDYRMVTGLRSEIRGALDWFGHRSLEHTSVTDNDGLLESLSLRLDSPAPVRLGRSLNLQLRPHFATSPTEEGRTVIHESALLETGVKRARPLTEHLRVHRAARDLVALSAWTFLPFEAQWVRRGSDPLRTLDGEPVSERWASIVASERPEPPHARAPRFLFDFPAVGASGFRRWLRLRDHFERGVSPMMATLEPSNRGLEGCLALSTIGLDGIGYQLALDQGKTRSAANRERQAARLERVAQGLSTAAGIDVAEWAKRAADANNGLKHANREMPDGLAMRRVLLENQLVFRLWSANQLGVEPRQLERNLRIDSMARSVAALREHHESQVLA